jgi:ParB-like chromosome segregation protein Spo0J
MLDILIKDIVVPKNRKQRKEDILLLMDSISKYGLLCSIIVEKSKKKYRLLDGLQRLVACKKLGHRVIHAAVLKDF